MAKHRCQRMSKLPYGINIEYDEHWSWCWTTPQVIEYIVHCPYCGIYLAKPSKP